MALVYLSSTYKDLRQEREAVYRALRRLRHDVIAMEDYVASDTRPLDKCLADVAKCDIYVGIFGWRYGYVPRASARSITELEFREAVRLEKKCLVCLQDETLKGTPADPLDRQRIETLRQELETAYLAAVFSSPDDLAARITASVANLFGELSEALGKLDLSLEQVAGMVAHLSDAPRLPVPQLLEEVDHLQRDAMNWVSDARFPRTAELRLTEARRLIAQALAHDPPPAALLALRGYVEKTAAQVHEAQGDAEGAKAAYREAGRFFRAAIELDPTDVGALNGQGNILLAEGQYQKAAVLGRIVTSYRPDYAAAFWDLGIALGHLRTANDDPRLLEELAEVYEALVALIPKEPGGFTPADLRYAQDAAEKYRRLARGAAGTPRSHRLTRRTAGANSRRGRKPGR